MRSDHLKRHMKKHVNLSLVDPICKDIKSNKDEASHSEELDELALSGDEKNWRKD